MLRGMVIISTAVLSIIVLKRKLYRHHWSSIGCIMTGLAIVGTAVFLESNQNAETTPTEFFGVVLLFIAPFFGAGLFVIEEKFLGEY